MDEYIEVLQLHPTHWWVSYVNNGMRHDIEMNLSKKQAEANAEVRKNISQLGIRRKG